MSKVIQGYFPHGPKLPAAPPPVPFAGRPPQPPVVQRHANAVALPPNLLRLGNRTGQPLPAPLLREMESLFAASFGDVRIHTGNEASSIGAHAFTEGASIYFAPGHFNPGTPNGKQLLGHELTHVIQQRQGRARNPFGSGVAVVHDRMMEAEADRMGVRAAAPISAPVQAKLNPRFTPPPPRPARNRIVQNCIVQRSTSDPNPIRDVIRQVRNTGQYYKGLFSENLDKTLRNTGKHFTGIGRDLVKFKPSDEDWFHTRAKKKVFNYGVDVVTDNINLIWDVTKGYGSGVFSKVIPKTRDRLDPSNIMTVFTNPDLVKSYLSQRKTQIVQPIDFYYDPAGFAGKKSSQYKNTLYNVKDIYLGLDSDRRFKHGSNVVVDMTQQTIATAVGMWATMFTLFNAFPGARQNTKDMRDKLFPKEKLHGKVMRQFPLRLMFANPISRLFGNPWLAAAALVYTSLASIGLSLRDSRELMEKNPEIYRRLKENGTDTYRSGSYVDLIEATVGHSKKQ